MELNWLAWGGVVGGLIMLGLALLIAKMYPEDDGVDHKSWAIGKFEREYPTRVSVTAVRPLDPKDFEGKPT